MDIKIIENFHEFTGEYLTGDYVLERVVCSSEYADIEGLKLYIYNINKNVRNEISPLLPKYNLGDIYNVVNSKEYVYFLTGSSGEEDLFDFCFMRYNIFDETTEPIFSFSGHIEEYVSKYRLCFYILNDMYVLMQRKERVSNISGTYSGYFKYSLKLYNIIEDSTYDVYDENLNRNGIVSMEAVSDTVVLMKTGFSLLPDSRYNIFEKEEVPVESISFINVGQFISDIMIGQTNINTEIIDQAYYTRTFPYAYVNKEYVIYSAVNLETKEEEVIFYNYNTKEQKNCINKNVIRMTDLAKIHMINNVPYIFMVTDNKYNFINLDTMKTDISFDTDLTIRDAKEDIFIVSGTYKKGFFKKSDIPFFEVYTSTPKQQLLLREKGEYVCSVYTEKDELYIFTL